MTTGLKLVGIIDGAVGRFPELEEQVGRWVTRYEPELAKRGEQWIWTTDDPAQALRFDDPGDAFELYRKADGIRPWDGKPNRPITVFHVEVGPIE